MSLFEIIKKVIYEDDISVLFPLKETVEKNRKIELEKVLGEEIIKKIEDQHDLQINIINFLKDISKEEEKDK